MFRTVSLLIVFIVASPFGSRFLGQATPSSEAQVAIAAAVDAEVAAVVPGQMLQRAKATYLDGYGVVVTIEVAFERPRGPFSSARAPELIRQSSEVRRSQLKEIAIRLLGQHVATLDGLRADEQLTIVIYMLNTNPVDLPDLPTQLVVSVTKQDGTDLRSAVISAAAFADRVTIREY
jgi:hypothetical protein